MRTVACFDGLRDRSIAALAMCCDVKYGEENVEEYDEDRESFIQDAGFHKDSVLHLILRLAYVFLVLLALPYLSMTRCATNLILL
jgi:hypothetical protein